tara:strand:+ start:624 stop:1196 length:573 start_codon:yes stop_codon:yes gene_type:complete
MSFILDALKKSEIERQQKNTEFNEISKRKLSSKKSYWIWVIGILLTINLIMLAGLFSKINLGQDETKSSVKKNNITPINQINQPGKFSKKIESNKDQILYQRSVAQNSIPEFSRELLPTIDEVKSKNMNIPELHLDIHVYSEKPTDRFVFINMIKLKEGSQLNQGPKVIEITPSGVILDSEGSLFLLPRE